MSLTGAFSRSSSPTPAAVGATAQVATSTPTTSIMAHIAPNLNTNVLTDVSAKVDQAGPGAAGLATQAKAGIAASAEVGAQTLAAGADAIMKAKAEITACAEANGVGLQDAYPDVDMAPGSVAEMAMGLAAGKMADMTGQGTMAQLAKGALQGSEGLSMAEDIAKGMKGKPPEEIKAAIRETAIANSPNNWQAPAAGIIQDAGANPRLAQPLSIDFEALLEADDGALEKIVAFDGEDFSAFPELQAIQDNLAECDAKIGELSHIENVADIHSSRIEGAGLDAITAQASRLDVVADAYDKNTQWAMAGPLAKMLQSPEGLSKVGAAHEREADLRNIVDDHEVQQAVKQANMAPVGGMMG